MHLTPWTREGNQLLRNQAQAQGHPHERRNGPRSHTLQDTGAVLLHGALGDAQLVGGLLVERAPHHLQQRLALFIAQGGIAPAQLHKFLVRRAGLLPRAARAFDRVDQS